MKISVKFDKSDVGEVGASVTLERGPDDPGIVSVDGMAHSFKETSRIQVRHQFGRHEGREAGEWAEGAVEDIKHQIDEYRTTTPADYGTEY